MNTTTENLPPKVSASAGPDCALPLGSACRPDWEKIAKERGEGEVAERVKVATLRDALKRCLIMDPLDPFQRGDMIKRALKETEGEGVALPCWVVVQVKGSWGSEAVKTMPACLSVHMSEDAAEAEAKMRQGRGECVIWHESTLRLPNAALSNGCPESASESTPATNGQPLGAATCSRNL